MLYEEYTPYGSSAYRSSRSSVEVSARRYRYVGLERDDETGLYSMGARYYAAWLGRWTSADPLGIGADGPGLYNYTRGSPVVFVDPGGMHRETSEGVEDSRYRKKPTPNPVDAIRAVNAALSPEARAASSAAAARLDRAVQQKLAPAPETNGAVDTSAMLVIGLKRMTAEQPEAAPTGMQGPPDGPLPIGGLAGVVIGMFNAMATANAIERAQQRSEAEDVLRAIGQDEMADREQVAADRLMRGANELAAQNEEQGARGGIGAALAFITSALVLRKVRSHSEERPLKNLQARTSLQTEKAEVIKELERATQHFEHLMSRSTK